ncbi:hypothetical protein F4678DRAFT_455077 [Xylaria arbuscula]|nr:hypothetical protein F4678DRAFT_455077 [Xylaria arbuscula]
MLVEELLIGMMESLCDIAKNDPTKGKMEAPVKRLRATIGKLSKMDPSIPKELPEEQRTGYTFNAYHSSKQHNVGRGTQNNGEGTGNQFPGAHFSGSVAFGSGK